MLSERFTSDDIARVVARATGIPVQSLLKGEQERLVHVGTRLLEGIGRMYALAYGRCSKGIHDPSVPRTRTQMHVGVSYYSSHSQTIHLLRAERSNKKFVHKV
jgi:hypothetical protein